jgi:hypothetical protein
MGYWQELGKQQKVQRLVALPYPVRAIPLPKYNFKNKASTLHWQGAQVTGALKLLVTRTETARELRKLRNNHSSGSSETTGHSVWREIAKRHGGEGGDIGRLRN